MRRHGDTLVLAATDLSNFLGCAHRSGLDLAVAEGARPAPRVYVDASLAALQERGRAHEHAYLTHLKSQGLHVVEVSADAAPDARVTQTRDALRAGADVIYQGAFRAGRWLGYADILRKVLNRPGTTSGLGDWHYEPYDTKLAQETRGGTILQLALYADLLADAQGIPPAYFYVVTPGDPFVTHPYRVDDYAAYFRLIRARFVAHLERGHDAITSADYPEPVEHCDVCRWWEQCDARRRADDHLSFIAGVTRGQRTELTTHQAPTLAAAATLPLPLTFTPARGSVEALHRVVEQAQVQLEQRTTRTPVVRLLPVVPGDGLYKRSPTRA